MRRDLGLAFIPVRSSTTLFGAVAIAVCGLTACAVGPSTDVRPVVPSTSSHTANATTPAARTFLDSLSGARDADRPDSASRTLWKPVTLTVDSTRDLQWLDILRDSQVVKLVQQALVNNRDLRLAEARVREYRAERGIAASEFFPQITANGAASKNKAIFATQPPVKYNAVAVTANLGWELDLWGRIRRQTQAANFDLLGREQEVRETELTLVSDVVTAYLQLREADENLQIAEQTLESRKVTLDLSRRRFAQGVISELDVRQFEADVADPAARVAQFAQERTQQENALSLLLGTTPGPITRGLSLEGVVQSISVPDSIPGSLIARRPDVLAAQHDWQASIARVGAAVASRLPTFTLNGEYGSQRPTANGLFTPQGEIYTLQAGVSLPLFTGGRLLNTQRAAQARADESKATYEQTVLSAEREVSDALAGTRLNRDQLVAQETQVRALEIAFSLAQRRYASGVSSYLEVLDAQRSLFTAQLSLVQEEQAYLGSIVQLYKALGGSWGKASH